MTDPDVPASDPDAAATGAGGEPGARERAVIGRWSSTLFAVAAPSNA